MQNKAQQLGQLLQQPRVVITADQMSFKIIFIAGMWNVSDICSAHDRSISIYVVTIIIRYTGEDPLFQISEINIDISDYFTGH